MSSSNCIWHPFTQMKTASPPLKVRSAQGAIIELEDGRQLIDCISSWWVNLHGHGHPKISAAIHQQALRLEHVLFAGFTHEPAEQLAQKLLEVLPKNLKKVFFSDNGSTAVEVALKQAYQYWYNRGEMDRTSFLCFEGAYHGDTVGAMSLGGRSLFTKPFNDLLFDVHYAPFPADHSKNVFEKEQQTLSFIDSELSARSFAAVVIEPLIQGANGMRICRPEFLTQLQKLVHRHNTLLIYDEVMTGFGRTGDWFASTKTDTQPDIICLAKGLTGGFLPLAVTVCSEEIYESFYSDDSLKTFFHGHSYTANPLGCAAALASIELLHAQPDLFAGMQQRHQPYLERLRNYPCFENIRCCGTIAALDVVVQGQKGYLHQIGPQIRIRLLELGLLVRPLGNVLYLMPPYCITDAQLDHIYRGIETVAKERIILF